MSVPDSVYQEALAQIDTLITEKTIIEEQLATGLASFKIMKEERDELRDERKMDILRATMRRIFETIDMENPPANLGTKIGNFVDNLYNSMYI